jgi:hypothetical protein
MQTTLKQRDRNPIFHKYIDEGSQPTTYISPNRRKEIYDFMRLKVNCAPVQASAKSVKITPTTTDIDI